MRYAILSDIHANLPALEAVLADFPDPTMPIWFLGDAVGYYPYANQVLGRLRQLSAAGQLLIWLRGNHDEALIAPQAQLRLLDMQGVALAAIRRTRDMIGDDLCDLLRSLAAGPMIPPEHPEISLIHGSPADPLMHYLHSKVDAPLAAPHCRTRLCLVGHTHAPLKLFSMNPDKPGSWRQQPLFKTSNNTYHYDEAMVFLNPGSVGQPRDGFRLKYGQSHAAYAILDTKERTFAVRRVVYDASQLLADTAAWLSADLDQQALAVHLERLSHGV